MSCSFKKSHNHAPFNVQYILPNLLLQWISKNKSGISGIKYFSTKTLQLRFSAIGFNFVFPPQTDVLQHKGLCSKLQEMFVLTKPISWQMLGAMPEVPRNASSVYSYFGDDDFNKCLIASYESTLFASHERKLGVLKFDRADI